MEWIGLVTLGLCMDISGAIIIVKPLLTIVKRVKDEQFGTEELVSKYTHRDKGKEDAELQKNASIGVVILGTGFFFQLLGNWVQYLGSLPK